MHISLRVDGDLDDGLDGVARVRDGDVEIVVDRRLLRTPAEFAAVASLLFLEALHEALPFVT